MPKAKITVTAQDKGVKDVLKVVSDLEAKIKSLEAQLKRYDAAQNQAQVSAMRLAKMQNALVQETERSHKSWLRHIATVASGILVYQGIRMAMGGVVTAISGGIKAVSDFQDRIISMTAMYTTFAKDQSDIAATYRLNKQYAEALVPVLQDIDRYTAMNLDQLMQVNHALAVQGIALNTNNKEQIQGYTNLSNAILFLTKGQATTRQIAQEIRALMNGQIRPGIDVLSEIINKKLNGNLKEHLAEWKKTAAAQKDSGYILAKLGETLDGFTPAAKDMANTWTGVTTSVETTMNILQREIFTDILADWIEYIKQLNDYLRTHKEEIAEAVKGVWEDMKKIALAIYENWDKVKIVLELIIGYKILNGILQLALAWEKVRKSVVLATEAIVVLETVTGSGAFLSGAMTAVGALTVKVGLLTIGIAAAGWAAYEAGERLGEFIRKGSGIKLGTLGGGMSQAQANEEWERLKAEGVLSRDGKSCKADLSSYMGSKPAPTQPAEIAINQNNGDNTTSRAQSRLEEQARKYAKALDDVKLLLEQTTAKQSAYDTEATKYIETENKVNKFLRDNNKYRQFGVVITDEQADAILKAAKANEVYNQSVASGGESGRLAKLKADVSEYLKYEKAGYITHKEFVEKTYEAIRDSQKSSMGYRLAVEAGGSKGVQAELALQLQEYVRFHDSKYLTDEEYSYKRLTATTEANRKLIALDNSTMGIMKQATLEWSDSWASTLNDMLWGAETSFVKILESFGQMITQMIIMKQLVEPVVGGLSGLFTSSSSSAIDASYNANAGTLFADGGIMTSKGSLPLRTYATGGIANRPQVSVFGEGSMAEAYVPLPDGRSIPVTMNANQQPAQPQTIKVEIVNESSEQLQTKNAQVKQDTSGMILSIVIDGINRNKMGMRDLISAR